MSSSNTRTPSQVRKEEIINLVIRQTNYSEEQAKQELENNNYDYLSVIKSYMNIPDKTQDNQSSNKTVNQQIYTEIRNFLDTGVEKYERNKRVAQRIQQIRQQQARAAQQNKIINNESNLETVTEEEDSEETVEEVPEETNE